MSNDLIGLQVLMRDAGLKYDPDSAYRGQFWADHVAVLSRGTVYDATYKQFDGLPDTGPLWVTTEVAWKQTVGCALLQKNKEQANNEGTRIMIYFAVGKNPCSGYTGIAQEAEQDNRFVYDPQSSSKCKCILM